MVSVVIFDLDGLLSDTETLHCHAYRSTLDEVGVSISEAEYAEHWIRKGLSIREFVSERSLDLNPKRLHARKVELYQELLRSSLQPMPGAIDLLDRLHGKKRMALASSSLADNVHLVLKLLNMADYFELIVTGESVSRVKPHPDPFLFVSEQMNVPPDQCVVIEDAEKGIVAAYSAGMKSIAVPNRLTSDNDFSKATAIVDSLDKITLDLLE
ncbi:MAG: HAD family phosphatase [candidate division Zixibacteria bacterium]